MNALAHAREFLFSVDDLLAMSAAGLFTDGVRVELVEGRLIEMPAEGWPHMDINSRVLRTLVLALAARPDLEAVWRIMSTPTLRLEHRNARIPDEAFIRRSDIEAEQRLLEPRDLGFVVETAHTSLRDDEGDKTDDYLRFGVPEVWIVRVEHRDVHVKRRPGETSYREDFIAKPGDVIAPLSEPDYRIAVAEFFPPVRDA